ncbi:MAG: HAMP domain-containing histidine kinase, partial [Clostridiales bacterium]|nr:HAMP domain-containing histidine kinase [Clostridiales bacterium]
EGPTVRFEVSDNGVGIPEADLARIWDSGFTTHGSTGLGMGFVKSAVERSDGAVSIVSRPGSGSRVIFQIPEEVRDEKADDDTLD